MVISWEGATRQIQFVVVATMVGLAGEAKQKEKIPVPDIFGSYEPLPFAGTSLASSSSKSSKRPCGPAARAIAAAVAKGVIWRTLEGCAWFAFSFYSYISFGVYMFVI